MNDWINFFYFFIIGAALLLSVLGLWLTVILPDVDKPSGTAEIPMSARSISACGRDRPIQEALSSWRTMAAALSPADDDESHIAPKNIR